MITWRQGRVLEVLPGWAGALVLQVAVAAEQDSSETSLRALAYPELVGTPVVGDRVLLNATALHRGLGTGGYALVVAVPDRPEAWPTDRDGQAGHLVKARYTPLQPMVLGVDDPEGEHHAALADADSLDGMPVVATDLHSALPAVLAGIRDEAPEARVAYVMSDGGALPLAWSRTVAGLREAGWLACTITAGQAFGGDLEAVTVHTALLAARHVVGADLAVVVQGPGNLGTETRWGFSGVAAGEALNAAAVLDGRPVAGLRVSQADARPRHQGLSHHSRTAFGRVLAHPADLPIPVAFPPSPTERALCTDRASAVHRPGERPALDACLERVAEQAAELVAEAPHLRAVPVPTQGLLEALRHTPVRLSTMGRGLEDDPAAFVAAAVAGRHAASLLR
ncbi:DUF3866 family protein [Ornithinimicrobium sp. LYQ92]|uniref:DUF3866 family protein n=1 Tax=Serinicoccus sp. LYQ92 TaxID=3378798 RepID=UPI003852CF34